MTVHSTDKSKITIRTIAQRCGVSVSTVSLAINHNPGVRPELRSLILKTIDELGWRSNNIQTRMGRLQGKRIVTLLGNPWMMSNYGGNPGLRTMSLVMEKFESMGVLPTVYYGRNQEALELCLLNHPLAVLLFTNNGLLMPKIRELLAAGIRVVMVHSELCEPLCPRIHSDHRNGGRTAAQHLQAMGCTHPAFLIALGSRFHCEEESMLDTVIRDYIQGIREIYPDFNFRTDAVGEACCDLSEVERMIRSAQYDGWIFELRQFFESFQFTAERLGLKTPFEKCVTFDTVERPSYPLSKFGCLAEDCEQIAQLAFDLATAEKPPAPIEYAIPYVWHGGLDSYAAPEAPATRA